MLMLRKILRRTRGPAPTRFGLLRREERGLAAVEFAFILPVMVTMLFGMGELSNALFARNDVTQITSTVADLVAQNSTMTSTDFSNVYNAANSIMYPYYTGATDASNPMSNRKPAIRIISVNYNSTAADTGWTGKVNWICTQTGTGTFPDTTPTANSAYSLKNASTSATATAMLASGGSVIVAQVAYDYTSPTAQTITSSAITMTDKFYTKPRRVGQIPKPASC